MKKLLFIADDIRLNTGVGIQARKLTKGLAKTGKYEVVEIGCALNHQNLNPIVEDNVLIYPINIQREYGDKNVLRYLISKEKPDFIIPFGDPRFFGYLFTMDDEIRKESQVLFYHTWDNAPFPKFNIPLYVGCDALVMISKFSYELIKPNVDMPVFLVQHGFDPTEFFIISEKERIEERENIRKLTGLKELNFIIFWNNRNISRKRPGDVMMVFKEFFKQHPDSAMIMNTDSIDREGIDILQFQRDLNFESIPIVFNFNKVDGTQLNKFYNMSDITLTMTHSEGFGLCVGESLCAGTPVVSTRTGGIPEQMSYIKHNEAQDDGVRACESYDEEIVFGTLISPDVKHLYGVPGASYIYQDYISHESTLNALNEMYYKKMNMKEEWEKMRKEGREFIVKNFHENLVIEKWDNILEQLSNTPSSYKRIKTATIV